MRKVKQLCSLLLAGTILATSLAPMTVSAASWRKNSVGWWYEEDNGSYPANQWKQINGNWYWFNKNGYMATDWQYIGGDWYYLQSSGAMIGQGWHVINGNWFYMYASGAMAADTWIGDSYVNSSGAWVQGKTKIQAGWVQSGSRWWYRHADGGYTRNGWEMIKGQWYFFDKDGWMVTGWKQIGGDWYYFQTSGAMIGQGWHVINGKWYYMYANGVMASNTWIDSDYVDSSGAWLYRADKKCRTVYAQFLRNKGYLNQEKGNKDPRFIMFDMNGDKVPELVIIHNINHLSGGYIYTYSTDGNVSYAGWVYGLYGSVAAYPSAGLIESGYAHQGTDLEEYFSLENGTLVSKGRWISSYLNGTQWYLNDVQTSQSRYEKWKAEHVTGDSVCLTYDTMYSITEKNIRTYLDW